jgi:hypothetical protein
MSALRETLSAHLAIDMTRISVRLHTFTLATGLCK